VVDGNRGGVEDDLHLIVKNLTTGAVERSLTRGSYSLTFVDLMTNRAASVGDILELTVQGAAKQNRYEPLRHVVSTTDVSAGRIRLPELRIYQIPVETKLLQNYPNPFNPETWIPFQLAEDAVVNLHIYDVTGAVVRTIAVGHRLAGVYQSKDRAIYWDGRNDFGERVANGIFFFSLTANTFTATRKLLIVK
jgi:hypothetical protein